MNNLTLRGVITAKKCISDSQTLTHQTVISLNLPNSNFTRKPWQQVNLETITDVFESPMKIRLAIAVSNIIIITSRSWVWELKERRFESFARSESGLSQLRIKFKHSTQTRTLQWKILQRKWYKDRKIRLRSSVMIITILWRSCEQIAFGYTAWFRSSKWLT